MSVLKGVAFLSLAVSSAYGHAFINFVNGANGVSGVGLGVTFNGEVARGGTGEQPFQLDTPVLKNMADDPCGATLLAGSVVIPDAIDKVSSAFGGLPTVPSNGTITMGMFQVNADGGGPFTAEINTDATGTSWSPLEVLSQPPGVNGALHNGPANSTITVQIGNNVTCTGANNACIIRFNNGGPGSGSIANGAGPFGGCVAIAQDTTTSTSTSSSSTNNNAAATKSKHMMKDTRELVYSRHFFPSLKAREEAVAELERRQKLTAQLIDELKTTTGTSIDIPIDALAGHDDAALLGGNSTVVTNATLSSQQAVDLKKAVQLAIEQALDLMASDEIDAGEFGQDSAITDKINAQAAADFADGRITSINAGNAGVGFFQTEVVDSLLGGIATASADLTATASADLTATATAATASATTTSTKKTKSKNNNAAKAKGNSRFSRVNRAAQ